MNWLDIVKPIHAERSLFSGRVVMLYNNKTTHYLVVGSPDTLESKGKHSLVFPLFDISSGEVKAVLKVYEDPSNEIVRLKYIKQLKR